MKLPHAAQRVALVVNALLGVLTQPARSQTQPWKTYTDTIHGYAFSYPPSYEVQQWGRGGLFLSDKHGRTEFFVEDWTRPVAHNPGTWDLRKLAANRARSSCTVSGPACSFDCTVQRVEEAPNTHGVRVVEVTRRGLGNCDTTWNRVLPPMYVADLSDRGTYFLLVVAPRLAHPGVALDMLRSIIATIRRVTK